MRFFLKNAFLLDGTENMEPRAASVLVEDGRIAEILEPDEVPALPCDEVIDLTGKYLCPGLINLHVHIPGSGGPMETNPKKKPKDTKKLVHLICTNPIVYRVGLALYKKYTRIDLLSGVTTIRSVGGVADLDTVTRELSDAGKIEAPRILASNMAVATEGGHMVGTVARACKTVEDARTMVRELAEQKVDLVKLMITGGVLDAEENGRPGVLRMKEDMVRACCEEAHRLGLLVAAHVESEEGIRIAARCGVDTIEHGAAIDSGTAAAMKENHSALICTISPMAVAISDLDPAETGFNASFRENSEIVKEGMLSGIRTALESGIPVGLGTDVGCGYVSHYDFWRELVYYVKFCGVTPKFALYSATLGNANIARIGGETGSITAGKSADMIVLDKNPLSDLTALRTPRAVLCRGRLIRNPKVKKYPRSEAILDEVMRRL